MDSLFVLLHVDENGQFPNAALEAVTAVKDLNVPFSIGVFGGAVQDGANRLADAGAETVYGVEGEPFKTSRYATDAAAAQALVKKADAKLVVAPHTPRLARIVGGVAARLDGVVDTHVSALAADGDLSATRWFYRQRIRANVQRSSRPWFLSIDAGIFAPFSGSAGSVDVQSVDVAVDDNLTRTTVQGVATPATDEQTIKPDADLLFVAGAGWTKKQADGGLKPEKAAELILGLLHSANASLGSTKSLVDLEGEGQSTLPFMTHMNQVGQTGSTPRHKKGLATCCHGEEPHVVGWRFINERRAINLDANCGWAHGKADVLYIADAFAVVEHLNKLLSE